MLKIVHAPHSILTKKVEPVKKVNKKIQELVYDMEETLIQQLDPQGVGLAAPQVNINLAIFIIKPTLKATTQVFINPHIVEFQNAKAESTKPSDEDEGIKLEGCLSIPHIWGPVTRNTRVLLEYQDLSGEKHSEWFSGFKSVIIQHEMDHLQGVLFTERVLEQKGKLYQEKDGELEKIEG